MSQWPPELEEWEMPIAVNTGIAGSGAYTKTAADDGTISITRTVSSNDDRYIIEIETPFVPERLTWSGYRCRYVTGVAELTDIQPSIAIKTPGAAAVIFLGDNNGDYATDHNTAAKRRTVGTHICVVQHPTVSPTRHASNERLQFHLVVDGVAGGGTLVLTDLIMLYTVSPR
jgi:hypothetical protein